LQFVNCQLFFSLLCAFMPLCLSFASLPRSLFSSPLLTFQQVNFSTFFCNLGIIAHFLEKAQRFR
jgi:hypothetical protein